MTFVPADPLVAGHLAVGIARYVRDVRDAGGRVPRELIDFADAATSRAREGLEGTSVDRLAEWLDAAAVPAELFTIAQVANRLAVSERQVKRLIEDGSLASVTVGRARRVRRTDLDAFVDSLPSSFRDQATLKEVS